MTQVLYRKWRPRRWDQVVGQEHVVRTLQNAVAAQRVAHAYLFSGPRGTGKTSTARLLAKAVNCLDGDEARRPCDECEHCEAVNQGRFLDLIEIDAASNTSVEDVRDLRDKINFSPNQGRYKVYIIDEAHMLSTAAFNALLKTLEEPPPHAIFVLATTEVHKIPATVLSRCQRHEFRRIPVADIVRQLEVMADGEGLDVDQEVLTYVARQATGSLRDAISLLDQLASTGQGINLEMAQVILGTAASQTVLEVVDALLDRQSASGLACIQRTMDAGTDPRQFARQIVDYLRNILLVRMGNADQVDAPAELRARLAVHAQGFSTPVLLDTLRAFNRAGTELRNTWQPRLPLEMAFVESLNLLALGETGGALDQEGGRPPAGMTSPAALSTTPADPGQPDSEAAAPGEEAPPAGSEGVTFQRVLDSWREFLGVIRQRNPQTQGLLNSCKPLGMKNRVLVLGFASDLLKSKMEKPENMDHARQALAQVLGEEIPIRCVVSAAVQDHLGRNLGDLDNEGMVAVALRDLGGEIVDIQ